MMQKLDRRQIDRIENILIAILAVTALFLVGKTGMFQNVTQESGQMMAASGVQEGALVRAEPVGILAQTPLGRCGIQYDQAAADDLYHSGLDQLLTQSLAAIGNPKPSSQEAWQQAILQGETWVFCDFLYNVTFDSRESDGEGAGRFFLVTVKNGKADGVHYYNQENDTYYSGRIRDSEITMPQVLDRLAANGGQFAFEVAEVADLLPATMLVLPEPPDCPVYGVSNPLAQLDEVGRNALLQSLGFNTRASSVYESADSVVIREGADTIRIQEDGTVIFHGSSSGEVRYGALSQRKIDLQTKAEEILTQAAGTLIGEGRFHCQKIETQGDDSVELTFCYLLDGAKVQLWEDGWGARFVFQDEVLTSFEIVFRQYTATTQAGAVLPERQAAAAAQAKGQGGRELQLCYRDDGTSQELAPVWTVREPG